MVANDPIIQLSASLTSDSPQISSSAVPGHCSRSVIQSFPSQKLHAQTIKDKGKAIVDDPVNEFSVPWTSKYFHSSSSISSDGSLSETSAAYTRELHVETRKDKENMFLENPNFEASEPSTPRVPLAPLASSGNLISSVVEVLNTPPPPEMRITRPASLTTTYSNSCGQLTLAMSSCYLCYI